MNLRVTLLWRSCVNFITIWQMTVHISQYYRDNIHEGMEYLVNTTKTVQGHKISFKQNMVKLLMKSRKPRKNRNLKASFVSASGQAETTFTDYTDKYLALETIEDHHQIIQFINYQRQKHSRGTQRSIKLFHNNRSRPQTSVQPKSQALNSTAISRHTSRSYSINQTNKSSINYDSRQSRTGNYDFYSSVFGQSTASRKSNFQSENLSSKMNEYLNLVLEKKEKGEYNVEDVDIKQQAIEAAIRQTQQETKTARQTSKNHYKMLANNFFRKMKKHNAGKLSDPSIKQRQSGSDELIKSLNRRLNINPQEMKWDKSREQNRTNMTADRGRREKGGWNQREMYRSLRQSRNRSSKNEWMSLSGVATAVNTSRKETIL